MTTDRKALAREGFIAGLVLYLTVAVFFAVLNVLEGRSPFFTVQVLGEPLLGATPAPGSPAREWAGAAAFNGTHLVASLVLGVVAALLVRAVERVQGAWYGFFFLFVAGSIMTIAVLGILTAETSHLVNWPAVAGAHLFGALTTTGYLVWKHSRSA